MEKMSIIGPLSVFVTLAVIIVAQSGCGDISSQSEEESIPQLGKRPVTDVVAAMSLEEKAALVVGTGMDMPGDAANGPGTSVVGNTGTLVPGAAGVTHAVSRVGIPPMVLADGPAGLRIRTTRENDATTYYCTAFPVATLMASTWDTDLVSEIGQAMGSEALEYGVDMLLSPGMNIHRNPLCGRNFEYYSEDPVVSGKMAAAMVRGVQSKGVGATIKHFAANNTETNRMALNTIVSERALREIYLEGFRIAVSEANPRAVMSAYNEINGTSCSESHDLLTRVLRNDWGYSGFVMTDWFAGSDAAAQMGAGNDLIMPGNPDQSVAIVKAVKEGRLDEKILDANVERILSALMQSPRFKGYAFSNRPDLKKHADLARRAAAEGMILLENRDSALPLSGDVKSIAAFGNTSYDSITGGTGSGDVNEAYSVALADGLKNAGYILDETLQGTYTTYLKEEKAKIPARTIFEPAVVIPEMVIPDDRIANSAENDDCAIITIGRNSGEFRDRRAEEGDFYLSTAEKSMITKVTDAFHARGKKSIVILNIGGVIETASWRDIPDAILLSWQAGQETGNSITDVLSGKVNPSGKLATTFPVHYDDVPSAKNFPGVVTRPIPENRKKEGTTGVPQSEPSEIAYPEGVYVGYRYYNTFQVPTAYEFGYGLSYTTFSYGNLKLGSDVFHQNLEASIDITNTGETAGREIVQLYLSAPSKKLEKPEKELKAFAKTRLLTPGESQTLSFVIDARALASYDSAASSWVADAGDYTVNIGSSSRNILQQGVFTLGETLSVEKTSRALTPEKAIDELKQSYSVTVDESMNGTVRIDPPLPEDGKYKTGTVITVTAVPNPGYVLDSCYYSAPGRFGPMFHESMASPFAVTIDREKHVGASFIEKGAVDHLNVIQDVVYAKPGAKALTYDVYSPKGASSLPIVVIIHGGGWAANTEDIMRGMARELTRNGKYVVCSIDYRWMGKLDGDTGDNTMADLIGDVYGAVAHIMEHASEYGGDSTKIALTGDSAGGHLSAAAANMPDKIGTGGFGIAPGVFEFMPSYMPKGKTIDQVRSGMMAAIQAVAPSYGIFSAELLKRFAGGPDGDAAAAEAIAPESHIPGAAERAVPHYLIRGAEDPLITDEAVKSYMDALVKAGQRVEYVQVGGASHAFFDWKPDAQTRATFAKYGVYYCRDMEAFFNSVFYADK